MTITPIGSVRSRLDVTFTGFDVMELGDGKCICWTASARSGDEDVKFAGSISLEEAVAYIRQLADLAQPQIDRLVSGL